MESRIQKLFLEETGEAKQIAMQIATSSRENVVGAVEWNPVSLAFLN